MPIAAHGVDYVSAPRDFDDLVRKYRAFIVNLVRRAGISEDSKEDVAHSIMLRIFERDFISQFDPNLVFVYNGEERPARFRSYLSRIVLVYVRSYREKEQKLARRELQLLDAPLADRSGHAEGADSAWLDVVCFKADRGRTPDPETQVIEAMTEAELIEGIRAHLLAVDRRSRSDQLNLAGLFDQLVHQAQTIGHRDVPALMATFDVSSTSMHQWLWRLRAEVADYLGRALPAKRARRLVA